MEAGLISELEVLLEPIIRNAHFNAVQTTEEADITLAFQDFLQIGLEQQQASLGNILKKMEQSARWGTTHAAERHLYEMSNQEPFDWFRNQKGRVIWFDKTSENFISDNGDQWENIGANLEEVKDNLNVPEDKNFQWGNLDFVTLGSGQGGSGLRGAFGPTVVDNSAQVQFSLYIENGGESALERIDGTTEIIGVNINITLSSETSAPVQITAVGGDFGISTSTPLGIDLAFPSDSFKPVPMFSNRVSHASGNAGTTIGLTSFNRLSRRLGDGGGFDIKLRSIVAFKVLQANKRRGQFDTSHTLKIR